MVTLRRTTTEDVLRFKPNAHVVKRLDGDGAQVVLLEPFQHGSELAWLHVYSQDGQDVQSECAIIYRSDLMNALDAMGWAKTDTHAEGSDKK